MAGIPVNYNEALTGSYTLPDVLTLKNGKKVKNANTWFKQRRSEVLRLYKENQFGKMPGRPASMSFNVYDKGTSVFDGKAIRKQVTVYFTKDTSKHKMDLLIYLPANSVKPVPLLFTANFSANLNATEDLGVKPSLTWTKDGKRISATPGRSFGKLNVFTQRNCEAITTEKFVINNVCIFNILINISYP